MRFRISPGHKPLILALLIIGAAYGVYLAADVLDIGDQGVTDCCAPEA